MFFHHPLFSCFNALSCVMYFAIAVNTISTVTMGGEVSVLILTGGEVVMWLVGGHVLPTH